jgi:hypothetical protein
MTPLRLAIVVLLSLGATVSRSPFCAGAEMAQMAQQRPPAMPPEGNPGHKEPDKGAFCSRSAKTEHNCKCHAKCVVEDENEPNVITRVEDPKCRAYCFKDHCHCPAECE